jgi:hypothetical protein
VPQGAWFSEVVCTAIHDGYVQGYPDGKFRPEQVVNRVETLKIVLNVLEFTIPTLTQEDRLSLDFLNVTHSSWYAPYLHRAFSLGMIPEEMLAGNDFNPSSELLRGEAAEIIYRAMNTEDTLEGNCNGEDTILESGVPLKQLPIHIEDSTIPAYAFDVSQNTTVEVRLTNSDGGGMSCVLFRLEESGFSNEFYVGYEEDSSCYIRAALSQGRYQIEGRNADTFDISVEPTDKGDKNDGFIQAVSLSEGQEVSETILSNEYEDWYRFIITEDSSPQTLTVNDGAEVSCGIYPSGNVDLFGEEGPQCQVEYEYPKGTYYVSIKRVAPLGSPLDYTIELQ